jgi:hypothetical protein
MYVVFNQTIAKNRRNGAAGHRFLTCCFEPRSPGD